ncbi:MAG: hypothetical protein DRO67_00305 [Candidatus Asgardarchaeum californiense]|nr:MAG: hypothetical protein DRO67_00305 [Candidatus Asgardarchaeum californiense]
MKTKHRIVNGLRQWNHVPDGYYQLKSDDTIQAHDVQKINDEWYLEYPNNSLLIGNYVGSANWYRKNDTT